MVSGGLLTVQKQFLKIERAELLLPSLFENSQLMDTPSGKTFSGKAAACIAGLIGIADLSFRTFPKPNSFTLIINNKS